MAQKKRLAVLGLGQGRKFVNCLRDRSDKLGAELVAACDLTVDPKTLPNFPDVPVYKDYADMMRDLSGDLDGIICALPNNLHLPVTKLAAELGLAMFVEKPIAATFEDARAMAEIVKESGIPFVVGHHRRFDPSVQKAKSVIDSGALGRIIAANFIWTVRKPDDYFNQTWRITPGVGGPLLINLIHEIDVMRYLIGEVDSIHSFTSNYNRGFPVEDSGVVNVRFKNQALLSCVFCDGTPSRYGFEVVANETNDFYNMHKDVYFFFGDKGQLSFPSMEVTRYTEECGGNDLHFPLYGELLPVPRYDALDGEVKHLVNMIDGTETSLCSAEDATETLRCIEAIKVSAETGSVVYMDEFMR